MCWICGNQHNSQQSSREALQRMTAMLQPLTDSSGQLHIFFNCEIYNFRSLRQKLIAHIH